MLSEQQLNQIGETFKQIQQSAKKSSAEDTQDIVESDQQETEIEEKCSCGKCHRIPRIHKLKINPQYFKDVVNGTKTFETRFNDRNFKVGDFLQLEEIDDKGYTGKRIVVEVIYILNDPQYCKEHYVTMAIKRRIERGCIL